ncbi:hypothetical protein pb186bvf_001168 [Paramecium bursaria]
MSKQQQSRLSLHTGNKFISLIPRYKQLKNQVKYTNLIKSNFLRISSIYQQILQVNISLEIIYYKNLFQEVFLSHNISKLIKNIRKYNNTNCYNSRNLS